MNLTKSVLALAAVLTTGIAFADQIGGGDHSAGHEGHEGHDGHEHEDHGDH